ncbi:MAG: beta-galactosidase [Chloroflexi bacterium]|nr:beta-galactosidase [Chloroflexota bacterium]
MPAVRVAERRVWVGQESRALLSGEVHYWRLDASAWPAVLERVRDLGLDIVSTYVCWNFHEVASGEFDFAGGRDARRHLGAFLRLAADRGMWVLLRPGPYIYAEWPNSGIPERLVKYHRLHPEFVREAKTWMAAVVDLARPFLATSGGPIVLWQADNEADPWLDVYGTQVRDLFEAFLRQRYTDVATLNAAWAASCADFSEACPVMAPVPQRFIPRYLDFCRFRHWYARQVVHWTTDEYRRLGVDVPIYANTYTGMAVQDWRAIDAACDLAGPDVYPTARIADDPEEHRALLDTVRYTRTFASLPFSPEFESGIWHGWHTRVGALPADQYDLTALSTLQAGLCGWNWYMLAARDSWYMSPITELGRLRPELAPTFAELVRLFRELDPPSLQKLTDTAATFNVLERAAHLDDVGRDVLRALYAADVDYEFFDLDSGSMGRPLLFYAGGTLVSTEQRQRLVDYVSGGGCLVVFQPGALFELAREPTGVTTAAAPQRLRLALGSARVELSSPAVFVYADSPGEPIIAERIAPLPPTQEGGLAHVQLPVGERLTVGYLAAHGTGRVVVLGVSPTPELVTALHAWLGVPIASQSGIGTRVQSAVFRRGDGHVAIVTNTADHVQDAVLRLDVGAPLRTACDLRTGQETPIADGGSVVVHVPPRSGTAVRLL